MRAGQDNGRNRRDGAGHSRVGLEPQAVGQIEVEKHEVDATAAETIQRRSEARHRLDHEMARPSPGQQLTHSHGVDRIVFDQQDGQRAVRPGPGGGEPETARQQRALAGRGQRVWHSHLVAPQSAHRMIFAPSGIRARMPLGRQTLCQFHLQYTK